MSGKCQKDNCKCKAVYRVENRLLCGRHCPKADKVEHNKLDDEYSLSDMEENTTITFFNTTKNKYSSFSNFHKSPFTYQNIVWNNAEQAYQAMKFYYNNNDVNDTKRMELVKGIINTDSALEAKKIGHMKGLIRLDWNSMNNSGFSTKEEFMIEIITAKVEQNPSIKKLLIQTGASKIVEGSTDNDFWSIGREGNGRNMLGFIYMLVRDKLMTS